MGWLIKQKLGMEHNFSIKYPVNAGVNAEYPFNACYPNCQLSS